MSKIDKYKTKLLLPGEGKIPTYNSASVSTFARSRGISLAEAKKSLKEIDTELKKSVTIERLTELRGLVNPSGIGIANGEIIQKRKYTRKTPEVAVDEVIPVTSRPLQEGDRVRLVTNRAGSRNRVGDIGILGRINGGDDIRNANAPVRVEGGATISINSYLSDLVRVDEQGQITDKPLPTPVIKTGKIPGVFKKGDKVRIVANTNGSVNRPGDIGIVLTDSRGTYDVQVQVGSHASSSNYTRLAEMEHYEDRPQTPEEIAAEKEAEKNLFGCFVPVGTVINTSVNNNNATGGHIYIITSLSKYGVDLTLQSNSASRPMKYTIAQFNSYLNSRSFRVVNTTPEIEAKIGLFNNIVKYKDFVNDSKSGNVPVSYFKVMKNGGTSTMPISAGFTGNCQLSVIGHMASLITISSDLKAQLREIYTWSNRKLLLCDIRNEYLKQLQEKLPKSAFNNITHYNSTNGSNMVICILNISNL